MKRSTHAPHHLILTLSLIAVVAAGCGQPRPVRLRSPGDPTDVGLDTPRVLSPRDRWVLDQTTTVTIAPPRDAQTVHLEVALDEGFQLALDRKVAPVERGEPVDITLDAVLEPGDTIHLRTCGVREDGTRTDWQTATLVVALATPSFIDETSSSVVAEGDAPSFSWTPVSGAAAYDVEVLGDSAGAAPVYAAHVDPSSTTRTIDGKLPPGDYRVRVRSVRESTQGEWSEPRAFRVVPPPCAVIEPRDGEDVRDRSPLLRWKSGIAGASVFELDIVEIDERGNSGRRIVRRVDAAPEADGSRTVRIPDDLQTGSRYAVRVRELAAEGQAPREWSAPTTFTVLLHRLDPAAVVPIVVDAASHATSPAVSTDGSLLAYVESPLDESSPAEPLFGSKIEPRRKLRLLERTASGDRPAFRELAGAHVIFPGVRDIEGAVCHPAWGVSESRDPVLLLSSALCEPGSFPSETRGALFRLRRLADRQLNLRPYSFRVSILHPTVALHGDNRRIYFEAQNLACDSSPASAVIGEIWSMTDSGADLRLHGLGHAPVISPDGTRLAYMAPGTNGPEIRVRPSTSGGRPGRTIVAADDPTQRFRGLCWSPRGTHLAFARDAGSGFDVILVEVDTGIETPITGAASDDVDPAFLPDALAPHGFAGIIFASTRGNGGWNLYYAEAPGQSG